MPPLAPGPTVSCRRPKRTSCTATTAYATEERVRLDIDTVTEQATIDERVRKEVIEIEVDDPETSKGRPARRAPATSTGLVVRNDPGLPPVEAIGPLREGVRSCSSKADALEVGIPERRASEVSVLQTTEHADTSGT
jgi:hypothetical protein